SLSWDDSVVDILYQTGYDPVYGARPIKRAIQRMVENPLSVQMLGGDFAAGSSILLTCKDSQVVALSM
ncbi:MAG: chaperone protein ClpB, partial [Spirochaetia bacterium]|nr:chaperone protein ClpB [Spirochaetia bacterium]